MQGAITEAVRKMMGTVRDLLQLWQAKTSPLEPQIAWSMEYTVPGLPQQRGCIECALFVMMFMHCLVLPKEGMELMDRVQQDDMAGLRVHFLTAMFLQLPVSL